MKKFFIVAMFLIGFCGISYATDQLLMESDVTWTENPTASYTTLAVSSVTYSTSTAINYGVNFVIQNNGTGNVTNQVLLEKNRGTVEFKGCLIEDEGTTPLCKNVVLNGVYPIKFDSCYFEGSSGSDVCDIEINDYSQIELSNCSNFGNTRSSGIVVNAASDIVLNNTSLTQFTKSMVGLENSTGTLIVSNSNVNPYGEETASPQYFNKSSSTYLTVVNGGGVGISTGNVANATLAINQRGVADTNIYAINRK